MVEDTSTYDVSDVSVDLDGDSVMWVNEVDASLFHPQPLYEDESSL